VTLGLDTDGDGLSDAWELEHFGNLSRNGTGDLDGDGISDYQEYLDGSDPASCLWSEVDSTHRSACVSHASILKNCLAEAGADGKHNIIKVVQGTYLGNFIYNGVEDFDLNLKGGYDPGCSTFSYNPELTILNGDIIGGDNIGDGVVLDLITLNPGGTGNITVEGFHVKNGYNGVDDGGCIRTYTDQGNTIISGNVISNCTSIKGGGLGIETVTGNALIVNNIIYGNVVSDQGGAIHAKTLTGRITLLNNTIADNTATNPSTPEDAIVGGVAILLQSETATADITNNILGYNITATGTCEDISLNRCHSNP
jgi:hypothetical protein